jgi:hypothetical protein
VNDTQEASSGKKSKKAHRGYAFIVYEREKDMKGIFPHPVSSTQSRVHR